MVREDTSNFGSGKLILWQGLGIRLGDEFVFACGLWDLCNCMLSCYLQNHEIGIASYVSQISDGPEPVGTGSSIQLLIPTVVLKHKVSIYV